MVEVRNVTQKFKHVTALKDAPIILEQDTIHGVIGRNGSAKTVPVKP
jgi:ABC-type multidrug transport system ATPase subunit